jgi:hypothetical protein
VLVIIASRFDPEAQSLAQRWSAYDATLLTAEDLAIPGWRYHLGDINSTTAVIGGRVVRTDEIRGVLTRWPGIHEHEVRHVGEEDRAYVAAEMTALLCSWITQLPCPVLNRPTASTLVGPGWRPEQWVCAGARLGIPVQPVRRKTRTTDWSFRAQIPSAVVTVVGEHCFGSTDPLLGEHARRLASAAAVDLLTVYFSDTGTSPALLGANLLPDLSDDDIAGAVLDYLLRDPLTQPPRELRE